MNFLGGYLKAKYQNGNIWVNFWVWLGVSKICTAWVINERKISVPTDHPVYATLNSLTLYFQLIVATIYGWYTKSIPCPLTLFRGLILSTQELFSSSTFLLFLFYEEFIEDIYHSCRIGDHLRRILSIFLIDYGSRYNVLNSFKLLICFSN